MHLTLTGSNVLKSPLDPPTTSDDTMNPDGLMQLNSLMGGGLRDISSLAESLENMKIREMSGDNRPLYQLRDRQGKIYCDIL
jgi:hypothetical protein